MSGDRPSGVVDDTSAMTDWETSIARSGYRVRLTDGKWHDVPNFALIDPKTNKLGYNTPVPVTGCPLPIGTVLQYARPSWNVTCVTPAQLFKIFAM